MFSSYLNYFSTDKVVHLQRYDVGLVCYLFFGNYRYFYVYSNFLVYICHGKKLFVERQMNYSNQTVYYRIRWCPKSIYNIGYVPEYISRLYTYWLNVVYKLVLNKLLRKAGTRRMVYKISMCRFLFQNRLKAGVFFLRDYSKNIVYYSFYMFLVFFNFLVLFNLKFTLFFSKRMIDFAGHTLDVGKRKIWFYRRLNRFSRRVKLLK